MRAPGLAMPGTPTSAGTYTSGMRFRTVCLAVPSKTKFIHTVSKAAAEPKGLCFGW